MLVRLSTIGLLLLACSPAPGRDIFVNNLAGSDQSSGASDVAAGRSGPVKTINCALKIAMQGDRIFIAKTAEPYREQLSISGPRLRGASRRPLVIKSDGAVLDGTVTAATGAWHNVGGDVFAMRPRRLAYQQLFRDGQPLTRVRLASYSGSSHALEPLEWVISDTALLLRVEKGKLPRWYDLRHAGLQTGVTLYNTQHVVIDGLVIQGFQQDGVNAHELVKHCTLRNVECRANGRSGLSVGGVSRVQAEACNLYDNGHTEVRTEGLAQLELNACDIDLRASTPAYETRGGKLTIDGEEVGSRR